MRHDDFDQVREFLFEPKIRGAYFRIAVRQVVNRACLRFELYGCPQRPPGENPMPEEMMMASSNGNIFRVTGPLCGEFTDNRWIRRTKASDAKIDVFFVLRMK